MQNDIDLPLSISFSLRRIWLDAELIGELYKHAAYLKRAYGADLKEFADSISLS
jgi:hypothetical protein